MIEFADFQCPACADLHASLRDVRKCYPDDFALVYRHFPLNMHPAAWPAAVASECAAVQGRFEQMHDVLFESQRTLESAQWDQLAARAGVTDINAFKACMGSTAIDSTVRRDRETAIALKGRGTPMLLVDGHRFYGAMPQARLDSIVESVLKKVRRSTD
jgi:protein-disulfide isomerase